MSAILFWALVGVVCLSPLPLASNRPLPWSMLSIAVGALLLAWGLNRLYAAVRPHQVFETEAKDDDVIQTPPTQANDRLAAVMVLGFALLLAWYAVQGSGLSAERAHAAWTEASAALGEPLSPVASLEPPAGETALMKILAYGGILLLAFDLGRDRARARMAFWIVCLSGFAYALYGLFVKFSGTATILWFSKDAYPESVTATFVNRNAYATYAGMTVMAGLAVLLSETRRLRGDRTTLMRFTKALSERGSLSLYVAIAASFTGIVAVVLTGSRAGLVCLLLALAVFGVCMLVAREIKPRTFLVAAATAAVVIVSVLYLSGGFLAKRMATDSAPEARAAIFDVARMAVGQEPLWGQGLGAFGPAFNRANDGSAVFDTYVDLAHNAYLELAVEGGLPALALSLALIGACIGICFSGLMTQYRAASTSIAVIGIAVLVGAHAMVDFGIQIPAVAANFMLLLGVATAQALVLDQAGRSTAPESARADGHWRSPRRRGFGLERPHSADEPVTPPPTLDMPWPTRSEPVDLSGRGRLGAPEPATPGASASDRRSDVVSPQLSAEPSASDDDYESAMARWRAVQTADEPATTSQPAHPADRPARPPALTIDADDVLPIDPTRGATDREPPDAPPDTSSRQPAPDPTAPSSPSSPDGGTSRQGPNVINLNRPPRS